MMSEICLNILIIFFANIGKELADNIPKISNQSYLNTMPPTTTNSLFLNPITPQELVKLTNEINNTTSKDCFGMSAKLLKDIREELKNVLADIFNQSFLFGIFPSCYKIAKVIAIHKSGDKQDVNNYRPIALLPQISKLLEKCFYKRLTDFVTNHKILYSGQHGFRSGHSTVHPIMDVVEQINSALSTKETAIGVFIDLRKAFDMLTMNYFLTNFKYMELEDLHYVG